MPVYIYYICIYVYIREQDEQNIYLIMKIMCHSGYYIYVMLILVLLDLSTMCAVDHLQLLILHSLLSLLSTLWFVCTNSVPSVHYVPKFIGCHKAIVVIPSRADYFHDIAHDFILLRLSPVPYNNWEGWWFEHSVP